MSVEVMSQYIHHMVLPQIIEEDRQEKIRAGEMNASEVQEYEKELQTLLKRYGLTCICLGTVYRWMKKLGFNYEPRKKSCSVDSHEKEATVNYRWSFVERYLQREQRMFRWIQI